MKNKRLQQIADLIDRQNRVADIGCDHGYLAIHLKKEKKCPTVIASDINQNALEIAKKNINKSHLQNKISCILSDGLDQIPIDEIDTIVVAGMGSHTILKILESEKVLNITNIILQSNNDYEYLRDTMNKKGYKLQKEIYIEEKGHDYFIMKYIKGEQNLSKLEIKYGLYNPQNQKYYEKIQKKNEQIAKQLPFLQWKKRITLKKERKELESWINIQI